MKLRTRAQSHNTKGRYSIAFPSPTATEPTITRAAKGEEKEEKIYSSHIWLPKATTAVVIIVIIVGKKGSVERRNEVTVECPNKGLWFLGPSLLNASSRVEPLICHFVWNATTTTTT